MHLEHYHLNHFLECILFLYCELIKFSVVILIAYFRLFMKPIIMH